MPMTAADPTPQGSQANAVTQPPRTPKKYGDLSRDSLALDTVCANVVFWIGKLARFLH